MIQPIVTTANNDSNVLRTSRSKRMPAMNKSRSVAAKSSKKEEEAVTGSHLENIASVFFYESTKEESSSDSNSKSSTNKSDVIAKRKPDRRRSYTSLLMERSKVGPYCSIVMSASLNLFDNCHYFAVVWETWGSY